MFAHRFISLVLVVGIVLVIAGVGRGSALATSISTSTATIDWSSLSISGINITFSGGGGSDSFASAGSDMGFDHERMLMGGWVNTNAFADALYAGGFAKTTGNELFASAFANADGISTKSAFSEGLADRTGFFTALGTGLLTISVNYNLTQNLSTQFMGEMAKGDALALLFLGNSSTGAELLKTVSNGGSGDFLDSGTLMLSLSYNSGDVGSFSFRVKAVANAVVPEPCSLFLLGIGLVGVAGARRWGRIGTRS